MTDLTLMRRRTARLLLAPALALALFAPAAAQRNAGPRVDVAALDRYIAEARAAWNVPGVAIAIVKDGQTVLAKGYGVHDINTSGAVDEHTLFAIASNTKAFTTAALAMLVDEGRLRWDDRVQDYLPWFQLYDPYVSREMRIRDLLSHRSGLGTYSGDLVWWGTPYSAEEVVRRARHLEPAGAFRGSYHYNNIMFIAAGEVLRVVTGKPWHVVVRERILAPLAMNRTEVSTDSLVGGHNIATPHKTVGNDNVPVAWMNWNSMGAAGGLISSAAEMAEWLKLLVRGGVTAAGDTLLDPAQLRTMWSLHTPRTVSPQYRQVYPSTHFLGYGLGWELRDYKGRMVASHTGGYDGMYSGVAVVPEENLAVVVMTNSMTNLYTALINRVLDTWLGGEVRDWSAQLLPVDRQGRESETARRAAFVRPTVPDTRPSLALDAYTGTYHSELYGDVRVALEDGRLVLRVLPYPELVADLRHRQFDTFAVEWRRSFAWFDNGVAQFVLDPAAAVTELKLNVPNQDLFFEELELLRQPAR